jgi:hypothetical protein
MEVFGKAHTASQARVNASLTTVAAPAVPHGNRLKRRSNHERTPAQRHSLARGEATWLCLRSNSPSSECKKVVMVAMPTPRDATASATVVASSSVVIVAHVRTSRHTGDSRPSRAMKERSAIRACARAHDAFSPRATHS